MCVYVHAFADSDSDLDPDTDSHVEPFPVSSSHSAQTFFGAPRHRSSPWTSASLKARSRIPGHIIHVEMPDVKVGYKIAGKDRTETMFVGSEFLSYVPAESDRSE